MKKITSIAFLTILVLLYLGVAHANEEESIDKLIGAYETATHNKDIEALKGLYYRAYFEIISTKGNKLVWNSSEGGKVFKEYEKNFRGIKSFKNTNRVITINQNVAYVHCEESQTLTNGRIEVFKSLLTCVKEGGRWYIASCSAQQIQ